jgi:glutamine amidotransferase
LINLYSARRGDYGSLFSKFVEYMIGIIDYQIGNIGSLRNAFSYIGAGVEVINSPNDLDIYSAIVLPGVGSFNPAMKALETSGFSSAIKSYAHAGRPLLGICLGMHILTQGSEEGDLVGLGLVPGGAVNLRNLDCKGKVPHVGFNAIQSVSHNSFFLESILNKDFYFVHSFAITSSSKECAIAIAEYEGANFVAALQQKNIYATQFHPEKSGEAGLMLLKQFLTCSKNA